jgi:FADH2 O2-dependent halogenase
LESHESKDFSRETFLPLEKSSLACIKNNDLLIANSYEAFKCPELWRKTQVLWLLGAYTEFLKLLTVRMRSKKSRDAYFKDFLQLKLVGGGFEGFSDFSENMYEVIKSTEGKTAAEIHEATLKMQKCFEEQSWIEPRFSAIMEGKKYLPKNKIRFELLKPLITKSIYRDHFFGNKRFPAIAVFVMKEFYKYSGVSLGVKRRFKYKN